MALVVEFADGGFGPPPVLFRRIKWARSVGGLRGLIARADANAQALWNFCSARDWIDNLANDPATRSNTSVCLKFTAPGISDGAAFAKAIAKRLADEGVALDVGVEIQVADATGV